MRARMGRSVRWISTISSSSGDIYAIYSYVYPLFLTSLLSRIISKKEKKGLKVSIEKESTSLFILPIYSYLCL